MSRLIQKIEGELLNNSYINPGLVHEVRVYDKKMSDSEITKIKQEMISKYGS